MSLRLSSGLCHCLHSGVRPCRYPWILLDFGASFHITLYAYVLASCTTLSLLYHVFTTDGTSLLVTHGGSLTPTYDTYSHFSIPSISMFSNFAWTSSQLANLLTKTVLSPSLPLLVFFMIVAQVRCLVCIVSIIDCIIWTLFVYLIPLFLLLVSVLRHDIPLLIFGIVG